MATCTPLSILMVAMVTTAIMSQVKMADSSCSSCRMYFENLQNKTQSGCRCMYYEVYSKDHPQVIADCNNLKEIPDFGAICNVTDIYTVNLQNNMIERVEANAFRALEMSDDALNWAGASPELILLSNKINFIHSDAFKGRMEVKLAQLDLRYNELTSIPDAVLKLKNLEKLYLKNNLITSAHGEAKLSKLKVLDLTNNRLNSFPSRACNFPSLRSLYLDGNPIAGDLSDYLDNLAECSQLRELTWPKATATCDQLALETYANTTSCKIMVVRNGDNQLVTCNSESSPEHRGVGFEWALRKELSKVCSDISGVGQIKTHWLALPVAIMLAIWKWFYAFG